MSFSLSILLAIWVPICMVGIPFIVISYVIEFRGEEGFFTSLATSLLYAIIAAIGGALLIAGAWLLTYIAYDLMVWTSQTLGNI